MKRRSFFQKAGATLAVASASSVPLPLQQATAGSTGQKIAALARHDVAGRCTPIIPIAARVDRITEIYTCLRPFRLAGPRIEAERLGNKLVVHNYGHGGTGWSMVALQLLKASASDSTRLGVIGCGPLGLTSAILAQRAGLEVTIYTKEVPPHVSSMGATGHWSPGSQFCAAQYGPKWHNRWIEMADFSYRMYQSLLGLQGDPVEWYYGYKLSEIPFAPALSVAAREGPDYAKFDNPNRHYQPIQMDLSPREHPFSYPYARRWQNMLFNINSYVRVLMSDFLAAGGKINIRHFDNADELLKLPEEALINATGYGAKALFKDTDIIPIRGQTARLVQQSDVHYAVRAEDFLFLPRRDGLVIQYIDRAGSYNNNNDAPDPQESADAVEQLSAVMAALQQ